jgi:hypothetical protein
MFKTNWMRLVFGWMAMWVDGANASSGGSTATSAPATSGGSGGSSGDSGGDPGDTGEGHSVGIVNRMASDEISDYVPDDDDVEPAVEGGSDGETSETSETPAAEPLPADLLAQARELGWTDEDLKDASPDAVKSEINRVYRALGKFGWAKSGETPPVNTPSTADSKVETPVVPSTTDDFKVTLDPATWGEDLPKALNDLHSHHQAKVAEATQQLNQRLDQVTQALSAVLTNSEQREFDAQLGTLGDEYSEVLGKGDANAVRANQEVFANRSKVWGRYVDLLNKVGASNGLSKSTLLRMAVAAELGDKVASGARKQVEAAVAKRQTQVMVRPVSREASKPTLSPREEAIKAMRAARKKMGIIEDDD